MNELTTLLGTKLLVVLSSDFKYKKLGLSHEILLLTFQE